MNLDRNQNGNNIRVLTVTSEWPTSEHPSWVPFIVQQVDYLRKAGVSMDVFSFRGAKNPINYLKAWLEVRKALKSNHYDLIHAQFGQSGIIALPKVVPLIVTFHGSDLQGDVTPGGGYSIQGKILQAVSRFVAALADEVIVVSPMLGKMISTNKIPHVIPCGLDLNLFVPMDKSIARQQVNLHLDKKLILFGGRPEMPVKRYDLALRAVSLILDGNVEMIVVNNIPHDQMPFYLNACDVLLLTSLHEGSPTIIKEALACNLPIVSTDAGDVRNRIENINGCVICENDDPETIAEDLKRTLNAGIRIDGRNHILDLDENILTQKILNVYDRAMKKQSK